MSYIRRWRARRRFRHYADALVLKHGLPQATTILLRQHNAAMRQVVEYGARSVGPIRTVTFMPVSGNFAAGTPLKVEQREP